MVQLRIFGSRSMVDLSELRKSFNNWCECNQHVEIVDIKTCPPLNEDCAWFIFVYYETKPDRSGRKFKSNYNKDC